MTLKNCTDYCAVILSLTMIVQFAIASDQATSDVRQGPVPIKANEYGVGRLVPDAVFMDIDGKTHRFNDARNCNVTVVALTGTGCPLCLKYAASLAQIENRYADQGVKFIFVNPNASESTQRIRSAIDKHGFVGPYIHDTKKQLPRMLQASTTTEVFVLDGARTLVYRGAVDDQYGFGYASDAPAHHYLSDAIDAVLRGDTPRVAATTSPGCELFYDAADKSNLTSSITYHSRVSRIIQANCIECHRDGGIAPMPFESYEQVRDYAAMIRSVIGRGVMPPWFAASPVGIEKDSAVAQHWANERSLSDSEKEDLFAWIAAGAPEGNSDDAPLAKSFADGWLIGKPDAVFEFPQPVAVKATGTMPYQNIIVETNLDEDKWVRAIEIRPGNRSVVHHVIVSLRSDAGDERSGYWGVYVPGNSTLDYPEGFGRWLPKAAQLRFQMHYTPNGTATQDSTRIGLIFCKEPPKHEVKVVGISNTQLNIPAGVANHPETASLTIPHDVQVVSFLPHMHLRGKAARYELSNADGTHVLLNVPRYDFNWQLCYRLSEPRALSAGDKIRYTSWYDNSAENPANPDPTRNVRWGPQTEDEMHLGYVEYIVSSEQPENGQRSGQDQHATGRGQDAVREKLFRRLDVNADRFITRAEVRERLSNDTKASGSTFNRLDLNKDEKIDRTEFSRL